MDKMKNGMLTIFLCILLTAFDGASVERVVSRSLGEEHHPKLQHSNQFGAFKKYDMFQNDDNFKLTLERVRRNE